MCTSWPADTSPPPASAGPSWCCAISARSRPLRSCAPPSRRWDGCRPGENGGMRTLRLALAQVDSTVGDLPGNAATVHEWTRRAAGAGAHLVAFPEMMLTGYPVEALVFRESFVAASRDALHRLAAGLERAGLGGLP